MHRIHKKAFTLIELLVVISIIALLLSILMPGLQKAKAVAHSVLCKSNLKQYQFATMMYFSENNDKLFVFDKTVAINTQPFELAELYIDNVNEIRFCSAIKAPSSSDISNAEKPANLNVNFANRSSSPSPMGDPTGWMQGSNKRPWLLNGEYASYTLNGNLYTGEEATGFKSASQIKSSGLVPAYGDGVWPDAWPHHESGIDHPETILEWGRVTFGANDTIQRYITNRHGFKTNMVYFDGHADTIKLIDLWRQRWGPPFKPLNDDDIRSLENIDVIIQ